MCFKKKRCLLFEKSDKGLSSRSIGFKHSINEFQHVFYPLCVTVLRRKKKKKSLKSEAEHPTSKTPEFGIGHGKGDQFISNDKLEQKCHI